MLKIFDTSHYQKLEIPHNWQWTTLEELVVLISGQDFSPEKYNSDRNGIPYIIGASNIRNNQVEITRWTEYPSVISEKDDLLIVCKGAGIGKMGINQVGTSHIARQIQAIRPFSDYINLEFLQLVLMKGIEQIVSQANGLIPGLPRDLLLKFPIPLPPLSEQNKIVQKTISTLRIVNLIEENSKVLERIISSMKSKILELAMQGKLVPQDPADEPAADMLRRINPKAKIITDNPHYPKLPDNWVLTTIGDIFKINPKNKVSDDTTAAFIPMNAIHDGFSDSFSYEERDWKDIKSGFTHFANGDVAVAKISPCLENRKSMILRNLPNGIGAGTTELLVFRSEILLPEFSLLFFKSDIFINSCTGTFNGVVGQQRVGKNIVEEIAIPIPPISTQKKIINIVKQWFILLDKIQVSLLN